MSLVGGCDLSSRRIDLCAVTYDEPLRIWLAQRPVKQHAGPLYGGAERVRAAADAFHDCIVQVNREAGVYELTNIAIEVPVGHGGRTLLPIFGALCGAVPRRMSVTGMNATQWRKEIGVHGSSKMSANIHVGEWLWENIGPLILEDHELDAIGLALAYRQMLHTSTPASTRVMLDVVRGERTT